MFGPRERGCSELLVTSVVSDLLAAQYYKNMRASGSREGKERGKGGREVVGVHIC